MTAKYYAVTKEKRKLRKSKKIDSKNGNYQLYADKDGFVTITRGDQSIVFDLEQVKQCINSVSEEE